MKLVVTELIEENMREDEMANNSSMKDWQARMVGPTRVTNVVGADSGKDIWIAQPIASSGTSSNKDH